LTECRCLKTDGASYYVVFGQRDETVFKDPKDIPHPEFVDQGQHLFEPFHSVAFFLFFALTDLHLKYHRRLHPPRDIVSIIQAEIAGTTLRY
jgi:hypothetical protein